MTPNAAARLRSPLLRPLSCGVLLALATLSASTVMAGTLDGEEKSITGADPVENWVLTGGAKLTVNGARTENITMTDSMAVLDGATVRRVSHPMNYPHAMDLLGSSQATIHNSLLEGGGIYLSDASTAVMTSSAIVIDDTAPAFDTSVLYGITITGARNPSLVLDDSTVTVADRPDLSRYGSGIGAALRGGSLTLQNQSKIAAANVGVLMDTTTRHDEAIRLVLDNAHVAAGRNAALEVVARNDVSNTYSLLIGNGSTLSSEHSDLLRVHAFNGQTTTGTTVVNFTVDDSDLTGDITFDDTRMQGSVNVLLRNNATLKGVFNNVTTAGIDGGSAWTLTGDSTVGTLTLGSTGTIDLGGDGTTFNTLTTDTFIGEGGTLVFNTVLEGDESQTDKLHITGDASGQAKVKVNGVGGNGALTDKGIELIDIDGQSNAVFTLEGRAVGGIYEYNRLLKDANGNWYLHSQEIDDENPEPDPPRPCDGDFVIPECNVTLPVEPGDPEDPTDPTDPTDPDKPAPVLRPETGAYLANQAAMGQLLQHSAADRMRGAAAHDGVRTWASTGHSEGRMDVTGKQRLDTRQSRLQVGADIAAFDGGQGRVGAMLSAGQADATSRSTVTGYAAQAKVEGGAAGIYAHWSNRATTLDASVQVGRFSNRVAGDGLAVERYNSSAVQAAMEASHRFEVGQIGGLALGVQPEAQLTYTRARMDTHLESTGTVVARDGGDGLSARVGVRLEGEAATAAGMFRPFVALHGHHDARDNAIAFDGVTVEGALPRSRVELSVGGQVQFRAGLSAWGELAGSQGSDAYRDIGARIGVSYRW